MKLLLSLLDANLKLHHHAARALEKAVKQRRLLLREDYLHSEHIYFQVYIALREVEIRELHLLHETALLSQMLKREEAARKLEQKLEKTFQAQQQGNGKDGAIISKKDLRKQERIIEKDHKEIRENAGRIVGIFLAEHEALVHAAQQFKALDPTLALLHPRADRKILKLYARAGGSSHHLHKTISEEVLLARPLDLADDLEARRSKMRHYMTALSQTRRHFATLIQEQLPLVGAL
jgi:hypothetical protein